MNHRTLHILGTGLLLSALSLPAQARQDWGRGARHNELHTVSVSVDTGCGRRSENMRVTQFRQIRHAGNRITFEASGSTSAHCRFQTGSVSTIVHITLPRHQARVDRYGYLLDPVPMRANYQCSAWSTWSRSTFCQVDMGNTPPPPPPPPPRDDPYPPGSRLQATAQIHVGCRGRVENLVVPGLRIENRGRNVSTYSGSIRLAHKCGDNRYIGVHVTATVPNREAREDRLGYLLAPAYNARFSCQGESGWTGSAYCQVINTY